MSVVERAKRHYRWNAWVFRGTVCQETQTSLDNFEEHLSHMHTETSHRTVQKRRNASKYSTTVVCIYTYTFMYVRYSDVLLFLLMSVARCSVDPLTYCWFVFCYYCMSSAACTAHRHAFAWTTLLRLVRSRQCPSSCSFFFTLLLLL